MRRFTSTLFPHYFWSLLAKIILFDCYSSVRITSEAHLVARFIFSNVSIWAILLFASAWVKSMERFFRTQRDYLGSFGLSDQIFLDQIVDILRKRMNVVENDFLFYEEKLKLLVKLLIDFCKFHHENIDPLRRDNIIIHKNRRKCLNKLDELLWM